MGWHGTCPGEGEVVGMQVDDNDDDGDDDYGDDYGDDCRKWVSWLTSLS